MCFNSHHAKFSRYSLNHIVGTSSSILKYTKIIHVAIDVLVGISLNLFCPSIAKKLAYVIIVIVLLDFDGS